MVSDNETNKVFFSAHLKTRYPELFSKLESAFQSSESTISLLDKTKDIWARDYMPVQVNENKFIEFRYDPDYLQGTVKNTREIKTYPDIVCDSLGLKTIKSDIILDGGNVVKSRNSVILTDKVFEENKGSYSKTKLLNEFERLFETERIIIIPCDKKEPYGHSDGMVRFIDDSTVMVNWIYNYKEFRQALFKPLQNRKLNVEFLDLKAKKLSKTNWAYINFLQTRDLIIVPAFGKDEDETAMKEIQRYYPSYHQEAIVLVNAKGIVELGGAFNCVSWTVASAPLDYPSTKHSLKPK